MKSKIIIIFVSLLLTSVTASYSQIRKDPRSDRYITSIFLGDGSCIEGYISHENLSTDTIEVVGYRTTVSVPQTYVSIEEYKDHPIATLSKDIKEWLDKHPIPERRYVAKAFIRPKNSLKKMDGFFMVNLESSNLDENGDETDEIAQDSKMLLAERGDVITYVDFNPHRYNITWKDIKRIEYPVVGYGNATFHDVIVDINGQDHVGEIKENVMRDHRKIILDNGTVETITGKNISSIGKESFLDRYSLLRTAPLLAILEFEDGEQTEEGVVVMDDKEKGRIRFLNMNEVMDNFSYDEVAAIRYIPNRNRVKASGRRNIESVINNITN